MFTFIYEWHSMLETGEFINIQMYFNNTNNNVTQMSSTLTVTQT